VYESPATLLQGVQSRSIAIVATKRRHTRASLAFDIG
jgi:hypothetical protein